MGTLVRGAIVVIGILVMIGGLAIIVYAPTGGGAGLWSVAMGAFLVVIPLLERQRYRSEAAEKQREAPGPGGGESAGDPLEARFRPTAEVFVDPTTGHQMRVLVDPRTGERRYIAEG
jgi:hypothetical protein